MALLQVSRLVLSSSTSCPRPKSAVSIPKLPKFNVSIPKIPMKKQTLSVKEPSFEFVESLPLSLKQRRGSDAIQRARLNTVLEEVMDRIEMHKNIGDQRNNWNSLLLNSVNMITLTAALMAGTASVNAHGVDSVTAVKIASTVLLTSATGFPALMSKIQPSQLTEDQRNATRLFKRLRVEIEMFLRINEVITDEDVKEAIKRVLSLDKAYPLPLIGTLLEKFPEEFKPASWWPENNRKSPKTGLANGWSQELEAEMREVDHVVKSRDAEEYERLGNVALKLNRFLAISGPVLTGVSAVSSVFIGQDSGLAGIVAMTCASLAAVVNTLEHGGQVGMVFEMYRNSAGFFSLLEETMNSTEKKENGQGYETRVAVKLGRSLSELRDRTFLKLRLMNSQASFSSFSMLERTFFILYLYR